MAQAEPRSITRRALMGSLVVASALTHVDMTHALDEGQQFEIWEAEVSRLHAQADQIDDTDITDSMFARAHELDELIRDTPATGRKAMAIKARCLVRYADDFDTQLSDVARHLLAFAMAPN